MTDGISPNEALNDSLAKKPRNTNNVPSMEELDEKYPEEKFINRLEYKATHPAKEIQETSLAIANEKIDVADRKGNIYANKIASIERTRFKGNIGEFGFEVEGPIEDVLKVVEIIRA